MLILLTHHSDLFIQSYAVTLSDFLEGQILGSDVVVCTEAPFFGIAKFYLLFFVSIRAQKVVACFEAELVCTQNLYFFLWSVGRSDSQDFLLLLFHWFLLSHYSLDLSFFLFFLKLCQMHPMCYKRWRTKLNISFEGWLNNAKLNRISCLWLKRTNFLASEVLTISSLTRVLPFYCDLIH